MRTMLLSAAGAAALAAFAFTGNAQAQCWRDGFGSYNCAAPPVTYYQPYYEPYYQPYPSWGTPYAAWNSYDYRNYRYDPTWLPSQPGPRPGGH
jgi:hypothetical protein